jgi:Flp pilus assembly protein TadG
MNGKRKKYSSENGQSMMEFAFGMVFLLIILAGIVDGGRALFTYMALRDGAQEGALYGSTNPTGNAEIENRVRQSSNLLTEITNDEKASTSVQINVSGPACTGNAITVRVAYDNFPITMPFLGALLGSQSVPIRASVTDTILSPGCPSE